MSCSSLSCSSFSGKALFTFPEATKWEGCDTLGKQIGYLIVQPFYYIGYFFSKVINYLAEGIRSVLENDVIINFFSFVNDRILSPAIQKIIDIVRFIFKDMIWAGLKKLGNGIHSVFVNDVTKNFCSFVNDRMLSPVIQKVIDIVRFIFKDIFYDLFLVNLYDYLISPLVDYILVPGKDLIADIFRGAYGGVYNQLNDDIQEGNRPPALEEAAEDEIESEDEEGSERDYV